MRAKGWAALAGMAVLVFLSGFCFQALSCSPQQGELSCGERWASASTACPLSQAEGESLVQRALASPQIQALMRELEARGYQREPGGEQPLAHEKGQQVLIPFQRASRSSPPAASGRH